MKTIALVTQIIWLTFLLWVMQGQGQTPTDQAKAQGKQQKQSHQNQESQLGPLQALGPPQGTGPLQGVSPGAVASASGDQETDSHPLRSAGPLKGADPLQSVGPLQGPGSDQSADPLQAAGTLQTAGPLQNATPLETIAATALSIPNMVLQLRPASEMPSGLALTPMQLATLRSGDAASVNDLLSQLLAGGNLSSNALSNLVEALLTSQKSSSATPALPTPTPLTGTLPPLVFPFPTNPIDYVSRS